MNERLVFLILLCLIGVLHIIGYWRKKAGEAAFAAAGMADKDEERDRYCRLAVMTGHRDAYRMFCFSRPDLFETHPPLKPFKSRGIRMAFYGYYYPSRYDALLGDLLAGEHLALENRPAGVPITTHVCRGNYHSTWVCQGAYDSVAKTLFARENVDAFYLEFDDERSGGFEPLVHVPEGKKVVLGLVTTKNPALEDKNAVIARIREASHYIPLERLYLSPQCGFAPCEIGNKLTEEEQWAKIRLIKEIVEEVWK